MMEKSIRAIFAETLADMNTSNATHFESECERFGMTWGCKPDCPVFERGECEKFGMTWGCKPDCPVFERGECELQEENEKMFEEEGEK